MASIIKNGILYDARAFTGHSKEYVSWNGLPKGQHLVDPKRTVWGLMKHTILVGWQCSCVRCPTVVCEVKLIMVKNKPSERMCLTFWYLLCWWLLKGSCSRYKCSQVKACTHLCDFIIVVGADDNKNPENYWLWMESSKGTQQSQCYPLLHAMWLTYTTLNIASLNMYKILSFGSPWKNVARCFCHLTSMPTKFQINFLLKRMLEIAHDHEHCTAILLQCSLKEKCYKCIACVLMNIENWCFWAWS